MLEDLRSLCRAAQAFADQVGSGASLTGFLEHAAGLHAQEIRARRGPPHHRLHDPPRQGHRSRSSCCCSAARSSCCRPGARCESADPEDLEEERRLFYVAATRAKDHLVLTRCHVRGGRATGGPSRFLAEAGLDTARARSPPDPPHPDTKEAPHAHPHPDAAGPAPPARTHDEALALFRRPFAPGAIGFRAMSKTAYNGDPWGGAQVAAYIGAQSVLQRLNCVVPGRWRMDFAALDGDLLAASADSDGRRRLYLACRLTVTLPHKPGGPDVDAVYEDIGELDAGSLAGLKALYSDARKRAGVAAGIGAYLYTALAAVVLPIGPGDRQVQCIRRTGKSDLLLLSPATEAWLRDGYRQRMHTDDRAARPRPDPRPRRTRRRHRPGREHRRRRPPQRASPPPPSRAARPPRRAAGRRRQRAAARPQRRAGHASTSAASAPPPRPRHEPRPRRGWPRWPPPPATGPTRSR